MSTSAQLARWVEFYLRTPSLAFWAWNPFIYTIVYGRHIGTDWGWGTGRDIPTFRAGVVVRSFYSAILGGVVVVKTNHPTHPYDTYCHLDTRTMPDVGERLERGEYLAHMAPKGGTTGSAWNGMHLHLVVSNLLSAGYERLQGMSISNYLNAYTLAKEIASEVANAPTPSPTPIQEEEEEMYIANVKNGNFYMVIGTKAHALGKGSGARESGIPIINYPGDWEVAQLKTVVSGITQ